MTTTVLEAARALFHAGDVVEIRVPRAGRERVVSGYFDDVDKLSAAIAQLETKKYPGIYRTLNPVKRALLSRADNRVKSFADFGTGDSDIDSRIWLPIDFDPVRPKGISSTDGEHQAAIDLAMGVRDQLAAEGWSAPIRVMVHTCSIGSIFRMMLRQRS